MNSSNTECAEVPVLVLFAPTAAGKTALLKTLFSQSSHSFFKGTAEIISADSMQVYRGMDIGTAKPDRQLLEELPHHLINIRSPHEQFTVADFTVNAQILCRSVYARGKLPVVAGGTGFYVRSLLTGLPETPSADPALRQELAERMKNEGCEKLYEQLCACDPESARVINAHDAYRIQRALEVYLTTGKKRSEFAVPKELRKGFRFFTLILEPPRSLLYERINSRTDEMFREGLAGEVEGLKAEGYTAADPGMKAIGYREWFTGGTESVICGRIKADSREYAKKQFTFIKGIPGGQIVEYTGSGEDIARISEKIMMFMRFLHLT